MRATAAEETQSGGLVLLCLAAWAHSGRRASVAGPPQRASSFSIALPLMFAIGLGDSRPPVSRSTSPIRSSASRRWPISASALTYFVASALGYGAGEVRAVTYEYGNAFLIVAGLLNLLVVIDAYDVALGRK